MNLLEHKDLLRGLLKQGDILNTLNGGGAMTYVEEQEYEDHLVLTFWAPTVPAEAFNVVLNNNSLVVFSLLPTSSGEAIEGAVGNFNIPMFFKKFTLPAYAEANHIEAVHEGDRLSIIVPFNHDKVPSKKFNIRQNRDED